MRRGLQKKRPFKVMWLCYNCGALHNTEEEGTKCCPAEEVFLCGRRAHRGGVKFHFDKADAKRCRYGAKTKECLTS